MKKLWVCGNPQSGSQNFLLDCTDAQTELNLRWVHMFFDKFVVHTIDTDIIADFLCFSQLLRCKEWMNAEYQ